MGKLTITLSDTMQRALEQAASRSGKTMGQIVEESLELYGLEAEQQARDLVARARQRADLRETRALDTSVRETREQRKR